MVFDIRSQNTTASPRIKPYLNPSPGTVLRISSDNRHSSGGTGWFFK